MHVCCPFEFIQACAHVGGACVHVEEEERSWCLLFV